MTRDSNKLNLPYTKAEMLSEVQATMRMENMELSADEVQLLAKYQRADGHERDAISNAIIGEYKEK